MRHRLASLAAGLGLVCGAAPLRALENGATAADAQPGLYRVGIGQRAAPTLAGTLGYGFTEPQDDAPGAHHRLSLSLAGAGAPIDWLSLAAAFGFRHDRHSGDSSNVIEGRLAARAFAPWEQLRLGLELGLWVPGAEDASSLADTLSPEARGLAGVVLDQARIGLNLGYRLDRSAGAVPDAAALGPGDRLALGVSSFDAVLMGMGAGVALGQSEVFGEVSADVLVGDGAPSLSESPLRAAGGFRHALSSSLAAELLTEFSLSSRPAFDADALVPVEPRVSVLAGLRYRFTPAEAKSPVVPPKRPSVETKAQPETTLELVVVDTDGAPVPNAKASLTIGKTTRDLALDPSGQYRDEHAPVGAAKLSIGAPGFEPAERAVVLEVAAPQKLVITLTALPPPSQVRGSVRSLGGVGVSARVRVEPLGLETMTNANGEFSLDVPPGNYEVAIEAEGYESQRRKVTVDPKGVVILNAELTTRK